jgi:hypothetical protein
MEAGQTPKGISAGAVVGETFEIYRDNVGALIGGAIAVFLIVGLLAGLLQNAGGIFLLLLASVVRIAGYAIFVGFVVRLVEDVRDGRRDHSAGDLFSAAMPSIGPLIGFGILSGIGIGFGFVLLIVPGLILLTIWSLGAPAIVAENAGVLDAFGRSRELVRGNGWSVFGTLLLVLLIVIVIEIVIGAIAAAIGNGAAAILIAAIVSSVITAPVFALAVSVMFFDLGGGGAVDLGGGGAVEPAPAMPPAPPAPPA